MPKITIQMYAKNSYGNLPARPRVEFDTEDLINDPMKRLIAIAAMKSANEDNRCRISIQTDDGYSDYEYLEHDDVNNMVHSEKIGLFLKNTAQNSKIDILTKEYANAICGNNASAFIGSCSYSVKLELPQINEKHGDELTPHVLECLTPDRKYVLCAALKVDDGRTNTYSDTTLASSEYETPADESSDILKPAIDAAYMLLFRKLSASLSFYGARNLDDAEELTRFTENTMRIERAHDLSLLEKYATANADERIASKFKPIIETCSLKYAARRNPKKHTESLSL